MPSARLLAAFACTAAIAALSTLAGAVPVTRNFEFKANVNEFPPVPANGNGYSACWSYIHGDGREYAIIGTYNNGTAIYNVTNPAAPYRVGLIAGPPSLWREMKSYRNWIYVVTEGTSAGAGVQIIRMTNPEAPVLAATYTTNFIRSHSVAVDTARALLICNGTNNTSGQATGMRILSIANPEAPVQLSWWPGGSLPVSASDYIHDSVPIGTTLYGSSINSGIQRIFNFSNPSVPAQVSSWTYPGAFSHNAWPSGDGNTLYITDETTGEPLKVFDITNVLSPVLSNGITSNPKAIVHNVHVLGDELYLSNYTEGIRALDIADPRHPAEFASADSYLGPSGGFFGVWEVCPYFPSGTVIASDMQTGLYVYRLARDYGVIRAKVEYAGGAPAVGVAVYLITQGDSLVTPADGIVQFAPSPGTHTVVAKKFGYYDASDTRLVGTGLRDTVVLTLAARPTVAWSGKVRDAVTTTGLLDAQIEIEYTGIHAHTTALGDYDFGNMPTDTYSIHVRRPGYVPISAVVNIGPGYPGQDFYLQPADDYDNLETNSGWTVGAPSDNAISGIWTRVEPLGTGDPQPAPAFMKRLATRDAQRDGGPVIEHEGHEEDGAIPGDVQPEVDRTPGTGTMCFVTGQGTNPGSIGEQDVDNGRTTLTTRAFDLTGMTEPTLGYWRWFYSNGQEGDYFRVSISNDNGVNWVMVSNLWGGYYTHWTEHAITVSNYVTPTSLMRVRFVAADSGAGGIVEAAVDDMVAYDAATALVGVPGPALPQTLRFSGPRPNPSRGDVTMELAIPQAALLAVEIFDVNGRRVRSLERGIAPAGARTLRWDGRDESGEQVQAGLYFVRARAGVSQAEARIVRMP
ncbi:MAG: choice-of-anchor B family protein [Candidatus Eisenbacteria bacterium]